MIDNTPCDTCGLTLAAALHDLRYKSPLVHPFKFPERGAGGAS